MNKGEIKYYESHNGNLKLAYRAWNSKESPHKIFVYIHGIESHSLWFANTANMLSGLGYAVYAPDRRGSGISEGSRGHMDSYYDILKDIKILFDTLKEQNPGIDIYIIGLSLGSSIAINYFLKYPDDFKGMVLISPAIETKIDLAHLRKLHVLLSVVFCPAKLFSIPIRVEMFTRNREFIEFIERDPLRIKKVSAKFYLEMLKMKYNHLRKAHLLKKPVLTLMAGQDAIIDNEAVIRWMEKLNSPSTYHIFEDACHSIQLEDDKTEKKVIDHIKDWVEGIHKS
jgi:alpha-beta hydrolase superfamily lysophospholipase